jgi:hypothetical protein
VASEWYFNDLVAGNKIRETIQDEFFATDVIRGAADALVREGVQNSLDAGTNGVVRVVIRVGELSGTGDLARLQPFMSGGWPHFAARGNGLANAPRPSDLCRFLVFEDFGTSGLSGDPEQLFPVENGDNRFFHFFRVEGRSDKHEHDRGRWGVGKQVFPRASRIKSVFGYTVRKDDRRQLLMGQAILRSHPVRETYFQDGWFGVRRANERPVFPIEDAETVNAFRDAFNVSRTDEPGLSLVVPYLQDEITERDILAAVLRGYFYPILMGDLEVVIRAGRTELIIDFDSIDKAVERLDADLRGEIKPLLNLAAWARDNREPVPELGVPDPLAAPQWADTSVPEQLQTYIREKLRGQEPFALRVPLMVRPKAAGRPQRPSHFDVLMLRDDKESSGRPVFVREGIIVSDVRGQRSRGIRSLVVVNRGALGTMLGDSENPAHTQWQKQGSKFKDKYYFGSAYIRYVADSVSEIVRICTESEDQEDLSLLSDIFAIPADEGEVGPAEGDADRDREDEKDRKRPEVSQSSAFRFIVSPVDGGFTIRPSGRLPLPASVRIRVAYDVRRGNAFSKYDVADFRLESMDVKVTGAEVFNTHQNEMILDVAQEEFSVTIRGFDPKRDVRVSANRIGAPQ